MYEVGAGGRNGASTACRPEGLGALPGTDLPEPAYGAGALHATRLAGLALQSWGLRDARLRLLRLGFKEVFCVESPSGERFLLRMYNVPRGAPRGGGPAGPDPRFRTGAGLRRPQTIRAQLDWVSALRRDTDLRVPEPVPTTDGSLVEYVPGASVSWLGAISRWALGRRGEGREDPGRNCVLLRWLPGEHRETPTPTDLSRVGSYVAKLHAHAEGYAIPEGAALPRWGWDWPFGESAPLWDRGEAFYSTEEMGVFRETARRVREDLERLGEGREAFGVIHRDLKFANLVFDGGRVGALDFDLCGPGHYLQDLRMLHFSLGFRDRENRESLWAVLLEAYGRERSLPEDYRRYFATFAAMQRVASVNRQLGLLGSEDADRRPPRYLKDSVPGLENYYLRWRG